MRVFVNGNQASYVPFGDEEAAVIAKRFPDVELLREEEQLEGSLDALLAWNADVPFVKRVLARYPDLRWIHTGMAGIPQPFLAALEGHPVVLTNGRGVHGEPIAEWVLSVVLAHNKRLAEMRGHQQDHEWVRGIRVREMAGQTVGILGLGDIGRATARRFRPFGVRLLGVRRTSGQVPEVDEVYGRGDLHAFLARLDVLVLAAPLTDETRGLIGAAEMAALPRGAYVVNVARGTLLDQTALVAALQSGHLGGAGLDVFEEEPLPPSSPLWDLPNVTVFPHACDRTDQSLRRTMDLLLDNLDRFLHNQPLRNVVDRVAGY